MIDLDLLTPLIASHDREAHLEDLRRAEKQRTQVLELFPKDGWPSMPLDRYALGQPEHPDNFCRWMEFVTLDIGSIRGGIARKHLIYFQAKVGEWWFDRKLYDSVEEAWSAVRGGFVDALGLGEAGEFEQVDGIGALRSGPALVTKTLHIYFPDELLPVFSQTHLRGFLRKLGEPRADDGTLGTVALNRLLLHGLRNHDDVSGWTTKELERLLYSSTINPFETPIFTTPIDDPAAFIRKSLVEATDERLAARRESEDAARRLLDSSAGSMSEAEVRELLRLFNADYHGKPVASRFAPAFVGFTANGLVAHLDDLNAYVRRIWQGSEEEANSAAGELLEDRRKLPSAGSTFPSMLMYLRNPDHRVVWGPSTDAGCVAWRHSLRPDHLASEARLNTPPSAQRRSSSWLRTTFHPSCSTGFCRVQLGSSPTAFARQPRTHGCFRPIRRSMRSTKLWPNSKVSIGWCDSIKTCGSQARKAEKTRSPM